MKIELNITRDSENSYTGLRDESFYDFHDLASDVESVVTAAAPIGDHPLMGVGRDLGTPHLMELAGSYLREAQAAVSYGEDAATFEDFAVKAISVIYFALLAKREQDAADWDAAAQA